MGHIVRGLDLMAFAADHDRLRLDYLAEQERLGCVRPEWRFAFVGDDGRVGARASYWGLPGGTRPVELDVLVAGDSDPDDIARLLSASLTDLGITEIDYLPARPRGGTRSPETEPAALEVAGFALLAIQRRLEHTAARPAVPPSPPEVTVRSVADLGYDVLVPLIAAAHESSGDRATRDREPAAELATLRQLEHDPASWHVGVDDTMSRLLGFVLPARTPERAAVIAFIGVVPEARGRGLGRHLLARATVSLRTDPSITRVVADVDAENTPMLRAAAAVGYTDFAARAHYRLRRRPSPVD
jgi:RimJ/RimL family protein N-acetyltransferase